MGTLDILVNNTMSRCNVVRFRVFLKWRFKSYSVKTVGGHRWPAKFATSGDILLLLFKSVTSGKRKVKKGGIAKDSPQVKIMNQVLFLGLSISLSHLERITNNEVASCLSFLFD